MSGGRHHSGSMSRPIYPPIHILPTSAGDKARSTHRWPRLHHLTGWSYSVCVRMSADIAVGAPHDGMSDEGAVYIFHGTKNGINKKPAQVRPSGGVKWIPATRAILEVDVRELLA